MRVSVRNMPCTLKYCFVIIEFPNECGILKKSIIYSFCVNLKFIKTKIYLLSMYMFYLKLPITSHKYFAPNYKLADTKHS